LKGLLTNTGLGKMSQPTKWFPGLIGRSCFCIMLIAVMGACSNARESTITATTAATQSVLKPSGQIVSIGQSSFSPQQVQVKIGESVTWVNEDTSKHTVTSWHEYWDQDNVARVDIGDLWDSGTLVPGQSYSHIFTEAGTFEYVSLPLLLYFQYQQNPKGVVVVSG